MKYLPICIYLLFAAAAVGQAPKTAPGKDLKDYTLSERFALMKSSAQTFHEYKVIKELVLDGVFKIISDSVKSKQALIAQSKAAITKLEADLQQANASVLQQKESVKEIVYDSTHISFLGISFNKTLFLTVVFLTIGGFVLLIGIVVGRLKLLQLALKDKSELAAILGQEYQEYKKKSMEKEIKLARELQTERNRLLELRRS